MKTLPQEVVNHIIGYTITPLKKEIAEDIQHFVKTKNYAKDIMDVEGIEQLENANNVDMYSLIWKRYIGYSSFVNLYENSMFISTYNGIQTNTNARIMYFQWGLMTIEEREIVIKHIDKVNRIINIIDNMVDDEFDDEYDNEEIEYDEHNHNTFWTF